MAIQSTDNLIAAFSAGQRDRYDWNKITGTTAYTAGRSYDFSQLAGMPIANAYPGTAKTWVSCNESAGNGTQIFGIPHGGNVSASLKHLINAATWTTAATGVPGLLMLVDMQGYWNGIDMNATGAQALSGTPTLRYANGAGCRLFLAALATTGSTAHNIAISYTNQSGTSGKTMPVTVAATISAIVPHIVHSGTAANNYGPFLPLANGDSGVQNVASVTLSAASGTASTAALVLARPIAQIPLSVASLVTEKDFLNQIPSLPRIIDGACLTWIYVAGAATAGNTTFNGHTEVVWG